MAQDKTDRLTVQVLNREAHLQYIKKTGVVDMAGPLLDGSGQMWISLIILEVKSIAEATAWATNDPYRQSNLSESAKLVEWNKLIG